VSGTSHPADAVSTTQTRIQWVLWGCLAAAIAAITVVVPPLVTASTGPGTPDGADAAVAAGQASASVSPSANAGAASPTGPATGPVAKGTPQSTPPPVVSTTNIAATVGTPTPGQTSPAKAKAKAKTTTTTLTPISITTTSGHIGDGQSVSNLRVRDLSGTVDAWDRYVEFSSGYAGYLTVKVPATVAPSAVTKIQVLVNYRGPAKSTQTWTFRLRNQNTNAWVEVGTNELAPDWGAWNMLSFQAPGTASAYVSTEQTIQVQITGSSARDQANLDYVAAVVTGTV
jgi:N-terminal glycosyl-hydrolase-114-associated domain